MKYPFRHYHLLELLSGYSQQKLPLDKYIYHYFRTHKALGSKDRAFIAEKTYEMVRWLKLIDHLSPLCDPTWECRFEIFESLDPKRYLNQEEIPLPIRLSFPDSLFMHLENSLGLEKAIAFCLASNQGAPLTIRVNPLKISRDALLEQWQSQGFPVVPCTHSPLGIVFLKRMQLFSLPEFTQGFFEMQDEGSQLLADLTEALPGQHVLDYCAGSGGKTLAFAPKMKGKGQIYLHDIREKALQEAKKRLKRAGIQNVQIGVSLKTFKKKMHWVLVDAPCSGTGTLRRNPDMKWKFSENTLRELIGKQRNIFESALSYLRPGGYIVYGTCSVLKEENEEQIEHFCRTYHLRVVGKPFISVPEKGKMDGFFGVILCSI